MDCPPYKINDTELAVFRKYVEDECGIVLGPEKAYLFEARLSSLMFEWGCESFKELYETVKDSCDSAVRDKIVDAITTQETFWFRDRAYWNAIEHTVLPEMAVRVRDEKRKLWVWSCGCSTGQEPYSFAMLAMESPYVITSSHGMGNTVIIRATDVSTAALRLAQLGRYNRVSIHRGALGLRKERYFTQDGNVWALNPEVKRLVTFQKFNLLDEPVTLGMFDIILCRYVLIYFSPAFRKALLERLNEVLRPGGYVILGASEGLFGDSEAFEIVENQNCIFYRKKQTGGTP